MPSRKQGVLWIIEIKQFSSRLKFLIRFPLAARHANVRSLTCPPIQTPIAPASQRVLPVSAIHQVMNRPRKLNPWSSWHENISARTPKPAPDRCAPRNTPLCGFSEV